MPKEHRQSIDPFHSERRKIRESGVLDALIDYVEGRRDLSSSQVSAALGLLKKAVSDLSTFIPLEEDEAGGKDKGRGKGASDVSAIEFRIVDPHR